MPCLDILTFLAFCSLPHLRCMQNIICYLIHLTALSPLHNDNCSSIYTGIFQSNLICLQRVKNSLARVIIRTAKISYLVSKDFTHWLPIKQRIEYKICLLVHKSLHSDQSLSSVLLHPLDLLLSRNFKYHSIGPRRNMLSLLLDPRFNILNQHKLTIDLKAMYYLLYI